MKSKQFDKDYYSTDGYDDYLKSFKQEGEETVKRLLSCLKLNFKAKILDVGCGMGGAVMAFRKFGYNCIGTEVSKYCLENSPVKRYIRTAGVISLPFKDDYFDLVICQDVLCYLDQKQIHKAIKELVGVTKKYLYIEVIPKDSPNSKQSINPDKLRLSKNLMTKAEWFKVLSAYGLEPLGEVDKIQDNPDFNYLFLKPDSKPDKIKSLAFSGEV